MAVTLTIRDVFQISPDIWRTRLQPADLRLFGESASRIGSTNVVLVTQRPTSHARDSICINPAHASVLNRGSTDETVIVLGEVSREQCGHVDPGTTLATGDLRFLRDMPGSLRTVGDLLLRTVRAEFAGDLRFHPPSKKFVEAPDNFWTVRIQPRDASFRITVRGRPESFVVGSELTLKNDMTGYSSFKIKSTDQLPAFMSILRQVAARK